MSPWIKKLKKNISFQYFQFNFSHQHLNNYISDIHINVKDTANIAAHCHGFSYSSAYWKIDLTFCANTEIVFTGVCFFSLPSSLPPFLSSSLPFFLFIDSIPHTVHFLSVIYLFCKWNFLPLNLPQLFLFSPTLFPLGTIDLFSVSISLFLSYVCSFVLFFRPHISEIIL